MGISLAIVLLLSACVTFADGNSRVQLTVDSSEADRVLAILALRSEGKPVEDSQWQQLFATEPYRRLKLRQEDIAKRFKDSSIVLTDDDFRKFVLSEDLLKQAPALNATLQEWKKADLQQAAERVLTYLPASAVIKAKIFPVIKQQKNSFVWETSTNPAIFLYVDPEISSAKFANTVAHELHHIGLASAQAEYEEAIKPLPVRAREVAQCMGAFGEGMAMLAAAGGPDVHPHAASPAADRERWDRDMTHFNSDLQAVDSFFLDILNGKLVGEDAISEKAGSFFGVQGPWYTVGYKMSVMVEKRFGRQALIETMLDPRRLLALYNRAAAEQNSGAKEKLPLWSDQVLKETHAERGND